MAKVLWKNFLKGGLNDQMEGNICEGKKGQGNFGKVEVISNPKLQNLL